MTALDEFFAEQQRLQAIPAAEPNRSLGDWIGDTAISAGGAAIGIPRAAVGLAQLVPGLHYLADPMGAGLDELSQGLYKYQSPQAQAARQRLGQAIQSGDYWGAAGEAFTPSNFVDLGLNAAASLAGMRLMGMAGKALAPTTYGRLATKAPYKLAGGLEGLYTAGAIGGAIADEQAGYDPARLAALPAGALTGLIGGASARWLPDPEMYGVLGMQGAQQVAAQQASNAARGSLAARMMANQYARTGYGAAKEGLEEFLQSGQESGWEQLASGEGVNPREMFAEALVGAIPGGAMGGVFGYKQKPAWQIDPSLTENPRAAAGLLPNAPGGPGITGAQAYAAMGGAYAAQPPPVVAPDGTLQSYPVGTDPYALARQRQIDAMALPENALIDIEDQYARNPLIGSALPLGTGRPGVPPGLRGDLSGLLTRPVYDRILNPQPGEAPLGPLDLVGLATPAGPYAAGLQRNAQIADQWGPWATAEDRVLGRREEEWRMQRAQEALAAMQRPQPPNQPLVGGVPTPAFAPGPTTVAGQMGAEEIMRREQENAAAAQRAAARGLAGEPIGEQQGMAFIIPENAPIPATAPRVELLDASRIPLATVIEGVGIQPDLFATQAVKDVLGYDHERAVTALVRVAILDRLGLGLESPEAAKRAITQLEELNLDDQVNQQKLLGYIQRYPNATASQIERYRTPGEKMYAKKHLLGKGVLPYTLPTSEQAAPEQAIVIPTKAEAAAQTEALNTQATAQAERSRQEVAAIRQVLAQTYEQRVAAAQQKAAAARAAGTYQPNPALQPGGIQYEKAMNAKATSTAKKTTPPKAPPKQGTVPVTPATTITPAAAPVTTASTAEATTTPAEPAYVAEARVFLAALGDGTPTAASNPKMNRILNGFGLETPKYQKATEKARRIKEALARYDAGQSVAETTAETNKPKTKGASKAARTAVTEELTSTEEETPEKATPSTDAFSLLMAKSAEPAVRTRWEQIQSAMRSTVKDLDTVNVVENEFTKYVVDNAKLSFGGKLTFTEFKRLYDSFAPRRAELLSAAKKPKQTAAVQRALKGGEGSSEIAKHVKLPYEFEVQDGLTVRAEGKAAIVNAGRIVTLLEINGVKVPFYISTGEGEKATVASGKWYPFFGIGLDGWINKTTEADINNYYGSEKLKQAAQWLDKTYGDLRPGNTLPLSMGTARKIDPKGPNTGENQEFVGATKALNVDMNPIWREHPDAYKWVKAEVKRVVDLVEGRTKEVTTASDDYTNALATTLNDPAFQSPLISEETRSQLDTISKTTDSYEKESKKLLISKDNSPEALSEIATKLGKHIETLNAAFAALEESVEGGRETLAAAEAASKGTVENEGGRQTSPATRFSRFYGPYKSGLKLDLVSVTEWRELNKNRLEHLKQDATAENAERAGRLTPRTRLGKIALGLNSNEREKIHKAARERMGGLYDAADENSLQEKAEAHAAVEFLLKEVISKEATNKLYPRLAETLLNALRQAGMIYDIKLEYYPHTRYGGRVPEAEYIHTKNGKHVIRIVGETVHDKYFLHEVVHAVTAAFVINNPASPEVAALKAILANPSIKQHLVSKFKATGRDFNALSGSDQVLELLAYGLTDAKLIEVMRAARIKQADNPEGFATLSGFMKTAGKMAYNVYRGFVNTIKSVFGVKSPRNSDELNGFDAFLEAYARTMTAVTVKIDEAIKGGKLGVAAMAPNREVSLWATNDGDLIEKADYAREIEQRAKDAQDRQTASMSRDAVGHTMPPSQKKAMETPESPVYQDTVERKAEIEARTGYRLVDAPGKLLMGWVPNLWEKYAGKDNTKLRAAIHKYAAKHKSQGRLLQNIVSDFGLPPMFMNAWRAIKGHLGNVDHLAYLVNSSNEYSFDEETQKKFLDAVDTGNTTGSYWLNRLVKTFREAVDMAREYNYIPPQLANAPYSTIFKWNEGEQIKQVAGLKYSEMKSFFTRNNGRLYDGVNQFLGMTSTDTTAPLSMWIRESTDSAGKPVAQYAFVKQSLDDTAQAQLVQTAYGTGFRKTSHTWYRVNDTTAYRPFTFAERREVDKKASAVRSAAAFIQDINHRVSGIVFNGEMVDENDSLAWEEKFVIEATDKNLERLAKDLGGKSRILYFDEAKGIDEKKELRTPGNWVVLRGTNWGALDKNGKTYVVPATVFNAIYDYNSGDQIIAPATLRKLNRFWKRNMTVWSTMAHGNNILTAFTTTYYNDIHPDDVKMAFKIILKLARKPETMTAKERAIYEEAEKRYALFGTFSTEEGITGILEEQLNALEELTTKGSNSVTNHFSMATALSGPLINGIRKARDGVLWTDRFAGDLYAHEDNVFRLAAYIGKVREITALNQGKPPSEAQLQEAGRWAADVNVNYDINAKYIKYARETVWPFIAWPYRQLGLMSKLAVNKPWKLLNTIAVFYTLDALMYAMLGMSDDDRDWERAALPDFMSEGIWGLSVAPSYVRMPWGKPGETGGFYGGARTVPLGDAQVVNDGMNVPQIAAPGGPLALAWQVITNRDLFHDRPIRDDMATSEENFKSMMSFILRGSAPAIGTRMFDVGDKLLNDKRGPFGSEANAYVELARLMGLNFREVNFAESAYNKSIAEKNDIQRLKANMRRAINRELRYGTPDMDAIQDTIEDYNELRLGLMEQ